jgi:hypothetical protein
MLANARDNLVIEKLSTAAFDELAVDRLALNPQQPVAELRAALVKVYFAAAKARQVSKATKRQLKNAKSALSWLTRAVVNLEKVSTDGRDGLRIRARKAVSQPSRALETKTGCETTRLRVVQARPKRALMRYPLSSVGMIHHADNWK